jgi:Ca2+-binding RTX toxin-like protein
MPSRAAWFIGSGVAVYVLALTAHSARAASVAFETVKLKDVVYFRASTGETNRLKISAFPGTWRFFDSGAVVSAGTGCTQIDAHTVDCDKLGPGGEIAVKTEDMNDRIDLRGRLHAIVRSASGNDVVQGGHGRDHLFGGNGKDVIYGHGAEDTLGGGPGDDRLVGGSMDDYLLGDEGNDVLSGGGNVDHLLGGLGSDTVFGNAGNDVFRMRDGNADEIHGGRGHDQAGVDRQLDRVENIEEFF